VPRVHALIADRWYADYNHAPDDHGAATGAGVVSHAGSRLLADLAGRTRSTVELSAALNGVRGSGHGMIQAPHWCGLRVLRRLDYHLPRTRCHRLAIAAIALPSPCRRLAVALLQAVDWTAAVDTDGEPRPIDEAAVAEITGLLPASTLAIYPPGTRVILRRERPQPGAQLDLIEQRDGYRYTGVATDTRIGQHAFLDARHRAHAPSRTASAPAAAPASHACPAAASRSTKPGSPRR
jgi:hypothetical protein